DRPAPRRNRRGLRAVRGGRLLRVCSWGGRHRFAGTHGLNLALILPSPVGQGKVLDQGTGALRIAHREPCRDARPGCNEPGPLSEGYLDKGTHGSLLMAFPARE